MTALEPLAPHDYQGEDPALVDEIRHITGDKLRLAFYVAKVTREAAEAYQDGDAPDTRDNDLAQRIIDTTDLNNGLHAEAVDGWTMLEILKVVVPEAPRVAQYEDLLWRRKAERDLEGNGPAVRSHAERLRAEARAKRAEATRDGAAFILGRPDNLPALWGAGQDVLWAGRQALMVVADTGIGKTTLAGLLVRAQLFGGDVLGLPVRPVTGNILYLAMDRPEQIGAAFARQFGDEHAAELAERLIFRPGPPPGDFAQNPGLLAKLAEQHRAQVVYLDSLKDAAIGLSNDTVGAAYNQARQQVLAEGRQLCELHHTTKGGGASFGSAWLAGGAGSVVQIEGKAGSDVGRLVHLKQPAGVVGPWRLHHDRRAGEIRRDRDGDDNAELTADVDLVAMAADGGVTARQAAEALNRTEKPSRAQIQQAIRELDRRVDTGQLERSQHAGPRGVVAWIPA